MARSKARVALDSWLAAAEGLLTEQLTQAQETRPHWDEAQEKKLAALGWQAPAMFSSPNRGKTPASEVVDPSEAESAAKTHARLA